MKTVTVRVDDNVYNLLKKAADGERRTISNFMENASLSYLTNEIYISDIEMEQILNDHSLIKSLKTGINEAKKGKYKFVK
ncbi:MAG: CopG family transcriptional regulator [Leptospiraceae bacterium]|nr:CopG family transcriptional regulator [Leptospiraceae bacterium]MCK6382190.1 CopG family transcriptional regulator [Leptospiraceae bacterium]